MYSLMIAEDETIERTTFKMLLSKYLPEIEVVAEAANGREAFELAQEFRPDIIIMDLKMPGIDGIEAIRLLNSKAGFKSRIVILTAYDNFNYIQEALRLGVSDYLLKPAKREKIIHTLRKVIEEIDSNNASMENKKKVDQRLSEIKPYVESEFISSLIFGDNEKNEQVKRLEFLNIPELSGYCMAIYLMSGNASGEFGEHQDGIPGSEIKKFIFNKIKTGYKSTVISLVANKIVAFVPVGSGMDEYQTMLDSINSASNIYREVRKVFKTDIYIGIGGLRNQLEDLTDSFRNALTALKYCRMGNCVVHYGDVANEMAGQTVFPADKEKMLLEALKTGDVGQCRSIGEEIFIWLAAECAGDLNMAKCYVHGFISYVARKLSDQGSLAVFGNLLLFGELQGIEDFQSVKNWTMTILMDTAVKLSGQNRNKAAGIMDAAVQYVSNNYSKNICLDDVARNLKMSPTYFSKMFKSIYGKNFIDYLTEYRIEKAKAFLEKGSASIKEIAYAIGYNDPNYFCKVFKKVVGHTPGEFKNQIT